MIPTVRPAIPSLTRTFVVSLVCLSARGIRLLAPFPFASVRLFRTSTHLKLRSSMRSMRPCASRGGAAAIACGEADGAKRALVEGNETTRRSPTRRKKEGKTQGRARMRNVDRRGPLMTTLASAGNGRRWVTTVSQRCGSESERDEQETSQRHHNGVGRRRESKRIVVVSRTCPSASATDREDEEGKTRTEERCRIIHCRASRGASTRVLPKCSLGTRGTLAFPAAF